MTIDDFLESLPTKAGGELRFELSGLEFVFEFPASFDGGADIILAGDKWVEICQKGFPASTEFGKYPVSDSAARRIGQLQAALVSPTWNHLDWHKLASAHGDAFATIWNRVKEWIDSMYTLTVTEAVEAEKKS